MRSLFINTQSLHTADVFWQGKQRLSDITVLSFVVSLLMYFYLSIAFNGLYLKPLKRIISYRTMLQILTIQYKVYHKHLQEHKICHIGAVQHPTVSPCCTNLVPRVSLLNIKFINVLVRLAQLVTDIYLIGFTQNSFKQSNLHVHILHIMCSSADFMDRCMDLSHTASGASVHRGRHSSLPVLG